MHSDNKMRKMGGRICVGCVWVIGWIGSAVLVAYLLSAVIDIMYPIDPCPFPQNGCIKNIEQMLTCHGYEMACSPFFGWGAPLPMSMERHPLDKPGGWVELLIYPVFSTPDQQVFVRHFYDYDKYRDVRKLIEFCHNPVVCGQPEVSYRPAENCTYCKTRLIDCAGTIGCTHIVSNPICDIGAHECEAAKAKIPTNPQIELKGPQIG